MKRREFLIKGAKLLGAGVLTACAKEFDGYDRVQIPENQAGNQGTGRQDDGYGSQENQAGNQGTGDQTNGYGSQENQAGNQGTGDQTNGFGTPVDQGNGFGTPENQKPEEAPGFRKASDIEKT